MVVQSTTSQPFILMKLVFRLVDTGERIGTAQVTVVPTKGSVLLIPTHIMNPNYRRYVVIDVEYNYKKTDQPITYVADTIYVNLAELPECS